MRLLCKVMPYVYKNISNLTGSFCVSLSYNMIVSAVFLQAVCTL